ncbi:MAG: PorP/SprF family type IX secretion system membrane protein [Saprospiraceae bacterium]|uniref:PorP/SprF family type IX secretion system membrane protein n=1 Tax=Candidatus Brachybacter algidus TaxID=2982024 RepID=UPI001B5F2430|nr:PorP/SprF family type IX secretion system membrane protein [Candidatus Brachybacter algidus]MBK7602532.1 PorP/SprF family type IX secretion system membrane protein [Candidatus Brachybacter algidus]MBK9399016.1 PorP/SprF family type IX secretion system membrane protein [Candidatus Brachybacter algidus]MBP9126069.1 PorP/SprF family type IX secretion system membrane protein [Saprospiraceae bacterium]
MNSYLYKVLSNIFICCTLILITNQNSYAQQLAQKGLYMLDPYSFNPAYGGLNNGLTLTGDFRNQWSNLQGKPLGGYFTAHLPLLNLNSGVGFSFSTESIGASNNTEGSFSYNYILPISPIFLSIGGGIGLSSRQLDGSILKTPDGQYENNVNHNDPNIPIDKVSANNGVINLGIVIRTGLLEIGLSSYQTVSTGISKNEKYNYKPVDHYLLYASYFYTFNENWKIVPNALIKYEKSALQSDIDIHLYNKNIFGGVGIRGYNSNSLDAIKVMVGGRITERILVAYNFESPISELKLYSGNTHELLLQYRIQANIIQREKEKLIYHPRM